MGLELRNYQKELLAYHLKEPRSIDTSAPSCGKTPVLAMWMKLRYQIDGCKSIFTMPSSILLKNQEEVINWTGWSEDEVVICNGTPKKREQMYKNPKAKCFLMTFSIYATEWEKLHKLQPEVNAVCMDESHLSVSTHTSQRTQSMYRSSRVFKYFLWATGSLINGRYSSVYPYLAVINPMWYGSYNNFLRYHAVYGPFNNIVGWARPERLKKILSLCSKGVTLDEAYPNRPENIIVVEKCEFDENLKKAYTDLEEDALLELTDEYLECKNPMVKSLKCRALLAAPELFDLPNPVKVNGKDEMVKTHIENALYDKERILIFACFKAEQERIVKICEKMGARVALMNGEVSSAKRGEIDKKFRHGELDVVVGSPKVLGFGFNFEFVKEIVFVDLDYQDSSVEQGILRGSRGTRTRPLPIYFLMYPCKLEKRIMQIIQRKKNERLKVEK